MTLLAVPFAVTTGRRGALYGIGVGIVVAIVYWIMLSIFGALGEGGVAGPGPCARGRQTSSSARSRSTWC